VTGHETPQHLVVGHIHKAHGVKGEVFVHSLTDHPDSVLAPGVVLSLGNDRGTLDGAAGTLTLRSIRPHKKGWLVHFEGVLSRSEAELLRGRYLMRAIEELPEREVDELFYHELLDLEVITVEGRGLGRVREVYEMQPHDLLEVRGGPSHHVIPFSRAIVKEVDLEAGRLVVDPPEGLLEL